MSLDTAIVSRIAPLKRVVSPNASDQTFPPVVPTGPPLRLDASGNITQGANGIWLVSDVLVGENLLFLQPLASAGVGQSFSLQVWGYRYFPDNQIRTLNVDVPIFLCELACTTGSIPGIPGGSVLDTENFCDTITLTAGSVGEHGEISSPATDPNNPRPNLPGFAVVNLRGSMLFRVVFQYQDLLTMNALWAPYTP